jgi:hypothetical protein
MSVPKTSLIVGCSLCFTSLFARAGDAVAIGYNSKNVWMMATYYSSSTPKGGRDYKDEAGAREAASLDVRRRAGEGLTKVDVISASDSTGYTAVARGENKSGNDVTTVGRGKTQVEAKTKALSNLNRNNATTKQKIVYRYFSYGSDFAPTVPKASPERRP